MSINIITIDKNWILNNINYIEKLSGYEFIYYSDNFSRNFVNDLDPLEREIRVEMMRSNNSGCPSSYFGYSLLKSFSESYISLEKSPNWIDIHFIKSNLGLLDLDGDIYSQSEYIKKQIIKYYESI